jgi:hypothetical protein
MNTMKRPISVLIVACLYILVGAAGLAAHFRELTAHQADAVGIELTELLAIVTGVFLLRRQNWARWLAVLWMGFHVAISFPVIGQMAVHLLFLLAITWALFRPEAGRYFANGPGPEA